MIRFILGRFLALIPLLFGISLLVFILMYITPGDILSEARASRDISKEYIQAMEKQFGLNEPWYIQYLLWLKSALTFNFGASWTYKVPVVNLLIQRVPATLTLAIGAIIIAWGIAIPLGILSAIYKDSLFDRISSILAYIALSIPEFFLALIAIFFAAKTGWFPIGGRTSITYEFLSPWNKFLDYIHHLILPTLVLALGSIAGMMRIMRSNFLDHIRSEYVITARAKGVPEGWIMFKHVLRNAINPLITAMGFTIAGLLSGALLVENIMNYPGLGQLIYDAFMRQDQYVVMASVLMGCIMLILGNLIADLLLAWTDPRIRLSNNNNK